MLPVTYSSDLDDTVDDIVDFGSDRQSINVNRHIPNEQDFCASFTLALEAKHNSSRAAIDDVLTATGSVVEQHLQNYA